MDPTLFPQIILLLTLLLTSGFFSGSEAALFSLSDLHFKRMRQEHERKGRLLQKLLRQPHRILITILSGNEISNVSISAIAGGLGVAFGLPGWLVIVLTTVTLLVLCEITPKTIARRWPSAFSLAILKPLRVIIVLFTPLRIILNSIIRIITFMDSSSVDEKRRPIGESEFLMMVDLSLKDGIIRRKESRLIEAVFELGNIDAGQIMTPRTEIYALTADTSLIDAYKLLRQKRFSRIPVYGEDLDDIQGILHVSDLIREVVHDVNEKTVLSACHSPIYVPQQKKVSRLFALLRKEKQHMAVVLDEYGGVSGIVTMDDIFSKLFSEFKTDSDSDKEKLIKKIALGVYLVSGRTEVEEFIRLTSAELNPQGNETMAGVVFSSFGHLPKSGEIVTTDGNVFKVLKMDGRRIAKIRVTVNQELET